MTSSNCAPCLCKCLKQCWQALANITPQSELNCRALPPPSVWINDYFVCVSTHMQDLQEVTQDLHYENFRSERLKRAGRWGTKASHINKKCVPVFYFFFFLTCIYIFFFCRAVDEDVLDKDQILLQKEAEVRTHTCISIWVSSWISFYKHLCLIYLNTWVIL